MLTEELIADYILKFGKLNEPLDCIVLAHELLTEVINPQLSPSDEELVERPQLSQSDEVLVERMASLLAMRFVYGRDSEFNPLNYTGLSETEKQVALKDARSLLSEIKPSIYQEGMKVGREEVINILKDLIDPNDCNIDHHGYCQEHGWLQSGLCPQFRAKMFLKEAK